MNENSHHTGRAPRGLPLPSAVPLPRESWKIFQIMAEFVSGFEQLAPLQPCVSVFGSARIAPGHPYYALMQDIARRLADAGFAVISGGGPGLMEAADLGAHAGRAPSVGLNIVLPREQCANAYQDLTLTFQHFFARKVMCVKYAKAYVVLPGGFGTLDEVIEALALMQTGKSVRMPVILVHRPFWDGLLEWFESTLVAQGMVGADELGLCSLADSADEVLDTIFAFYQRSGFEASAEEQEIKLNP